MMLKHAERNWENNEYLHNKVAQLEQRLALMEAMNNASIDAVLAFDTDLKIIAWNKTCEQLWDVLEEDALNTSFFTIFPTVKNSGTMTKAIGAALKGVKTFVPANKAAYAAGTYFESHFVPLKDEAGNVTGVLNIVHDVAHRVKAENELKSLNKSLARKNKELKQKNFELLSFTHITSHDLKEPLRKIYTFAEMILNKEAVFFTDAGKKYFKRIMAAVQRMNLLTDDILAYAQVNTEEKVLDQVDLNHILKFVKNNLAEKIDETGTVIKTDILPVITGYRTMLTQLFQNIIANAIKFQLPGDKPEISVRVKHIKGSEIKDADALADTEYACISFADNGIGFEPQYTERIFQMFQKLDNSERYAGTGIGLAICKKIVEMHQGFITAQSNPNGGSTFFCYLPLGAR